MESSSRPSTAPRRRAGVAALIAAAVIAVDQATKSWALSALANQSIDIVGSLRLHLSFNTGIAFSIGSDLPKWAAIAMPATVLVVLVLVGRSLSGRAATVALGLLGGGAIGNLIDRIFRGHDGAVVDFIDLQWWPIFNVADMAITTGAVMLAIVGLLPEPAPSSSSEAPGGAPAEDRNGPSADAATGAATPTSGPTDDHAR